MVDESRDFYLRQKEDGTMVFRIKVPPDLKRAFGRGEIQMNIPHRALTRELGACCKEHFSQLEGVAPMVDSFNSRKVRMAVKAHMQEIIKDWREGRPLDTDDKWYCEIERVETHIQNLCEWIGTRQFTEFAGRAGKNDPHLSRELLLGELEAYKQIKQEMQQGPHESVLNMPELPISMEEPEPPAPSAPPTPLTSQPPEPTGLTLGDALDQFVDHKLTTGKWSQNTVKDMTGRMKGMAFYFGKETPLSSITLDMGKLYVKRLRAMKQGFVGRKGAQAFIQGEREDPADRPLLDSTTVREYLMLARSVFTFCEASGWLTSVHPIPSMLIPVKKRGAKHNKKAFTPEQVDGLLSSKEFTVWADTPARRWLFPVLAYTGARIEEICKLRKQDIRKQDGVWVIDINEDLGRNKNEHSTRLVPIHDKLVAMGFIKYAESLPSEDSQQAGGSTAAGEDEPTMLFPELECYRGKWSAQILKNTNYFLHKGLGFGKGYSNHSFRHFANNELIKRGVRITVADQLLGRVQQGVGGQVYFKGHFMEIMQEAINQIP